MQMLKERDQFMELAKSRGYLGFDGKNYVFSNITTKSGNMAIRELGLPASAEKSGLYELALKYKTITTELLDALRSKAYLSPDLQINNPEAGIDTTSGEQHIKLLQENVAIYRSLKILPQFDPQAKRSGGITILAYNTATRTFIPGSIISIDGILWMRGLNREEVLNSKAVPHVWPVFNPFTTALTFETTDNVLGKESITALNTALPPQWMEYVEKHNVEPGIFGFIKKLIFHLFPQEEERERVLDWCHYAIFKRNGTVLCLAGSRGTGKSTFIELLSQLIGEQYTEMVGDAVLKEKFNSQFLNKRLIVFEEVALEGPKEVNRIKAWCNNKISIEQKGSDAFTADNFTSMVFLLNDLSQFRINAQERRFSIPVVADDNLHTVATEKEIDDFKRKIANKSPEVLEEIAAFGKYLMQRKPKYSEYTPIRGENFNRVAEMTLAGWQVYLREYITEHGEIGIKIPISKIFPTTGEKDGMRIPNRRDTIENFLRDYRPDMYTRLGKIVDLTDEEFRASSGSVRTDLPGGRTKRKYGILPDEKFLEKFGRKYFKVEDLL